MVPTVPASTQQSASILMLLNSRRKQLRISNLLYPAYGTFIFKPVNERLNGRVSDTLIFGQTIENLAHRSGS
jgi:hypothetical protein